ncbi:MAG: PepSY domain-containing protein [Christensenellales bacterium]
MALQWMLINSSQARSWPAVPGVGGWWNCWCPGFQVGVSQYPGCEPGIAIEKLCQLHAHGVIHVLFPQPKTFRSGVDPLWVVPLVDKNADWQRGRFFFDIRFSVCPAGKNVKPAGPSFFCHIGDYNEVKKNKEEASMKYNGKLWMAVAALGLCALLAGCSGSQISQEAALKTALNHAGVTQEDTTPYQWKRERKKAGRCMRSSSPPRIPSTSTMWPKTTGRLLPTSLKSQALGAPSSRPRILRLSQSGTGDNASQASPSVSGSGSITEEQATAIALEHAGVTQEETALYRVQADWEDGQPVYEVEFAVGTTEYDYTIAQETGRSSATIPTWRAGPPFAGESQAPGRAAESITLEQATQLVLERIPGASASDVRIYQEQDDGRTVYEGEAYYNHTEYEFEISKQWGVSRNGARITLI